MTFVNNSVINFFVIVTTLLVSVQCFASNRYYADNNLEPSSGFAWDWSAGAGYYVEDSYLVGMDSYDDGLEFDLNLALAYDNFYLDIDQSQLSGGVVIGYSMIDKYDWGLDILGTNVQAGFDESGLAFYNDTVIEELVGINSRHYDFDVGVRLTRRFKSAQISFEYLHDVTGSHNGWVINSFLSKIIPWRNWEFRTGVGVSAYSSDFINYYFGISADEATASRPIYQTDGGTSLVLELHGEYPINQHWVFLGGWLSTWFSEEISNSPIVSQGYQHKAKVGVRYVF